MGDGHGRLPPAQRAFPDVTSRTIRQNAPDAVHSRPSSTPKLSAMDEKARQKTAVVIGSCPQLPRCSMPCCRPLTGGHDSGAGVGGVATAARLAKAGYQVTVVEKNDFTGGRCSLIEHNGFVRPNRMLRLRPRPPH